MHGLSAVDTLASMSRFLSQNFLTPAWFILIGVVALSTPPPTIGMAAFLLIGGVVIVPAVVFSLGLRLRPAVASPRRARPIWQDAWRARAAAIAESDARDLLRMDSDQG